MQPSELLKTLALLAPKFQTQWDGPDNYYVGGDGTCTLHGVFAEFSSFFKAGANELTDEQCKQIGEFVSSCMKTPGTNLDNAAATCFVENIAGDPPAKKLRPFLTGEALNYLENWGG